MPIYPVKNNKGRVIKYNVKVSYTDKYGNYKKKTKTVKTRQEAREAERELEIMYKQNKTVVVKHTVKEVSEMYLEKKKNEIKKSSYSIYIRVLENHILPFCGDKKISKLTIKDFEEWKTFMYTKGLSVSTMNRSFIVFLNFLDYAVKFLDLPENLLAKVGRFKDPNAMKKEMDYYTYDEFQQFIKVAKDMVQEVSAKKRSIQEWHYYVFFNIAFYTGMRVGEIGALNWNDYKSPYITVNKSIGPVAGEGYVITSPKSEAAYRTIMIPKQLIKVLDEHYERCKEISGFSDDCFICGLDRALDRRTIDHRRTAYSNSASLKRIRIHDFRHSHVSFLVNAKVNIQEISRRIGHANVMTTLKIYSHLYPDEELRAMQAFEILEQE